MTQMRAAQLGEITATCETCGEAIATPATGTEIRQIDGELCLVVHMQSTDLELHMLNHNLCTCDWERTEIMAENHANPVDVLFERVYDAGCGVHTA